MPAPKSKARREIDEGEARNKKLLDKTRTKALNKMKKTKQSVESVVDQYKVLEQTDTTKLQRFDQFPLSEKTLKGLEENKFTIPTEIQRDTLAFTLTGSDVVGAAKTGSGKTLALVIPMLECLWRSRWSKEDGLGALIISPTRELALQTFTCISKVGKYHDFSAALLIGGTDVSFEKKRLHAMNIIVCTPGRLLQHMDENDNFPVDQLQMLVVDEADRILDMGFSEQINSIVDNLPRDRQSLLFSATQTKNVKQLGRLCAKDPVFVSVHEKAVHATPDQLSQSYMVCEEQHKINTLWSFIVANKKAKTLVFVNSCKQARFLTESLAHLRPGVSLMGLWGAMKQTKRIEVFETFEYRKSAVLIATDVASRGLDFTGVDWVLQFDCPAQVDDYIHRVGRTARMNKKGNSMLFLTPSQEEPMLKILEENNIPVQRMVPDPNALTDIRKKLQACNAQFPELVQYAQMSVVAYVRSVYLMSNKSVFDVESIDVKELAESYGLVQTPRIRFLKKVGKITKSGKKKIVERATEVSAGGGFGDEVDDMDDDIFTVAKTDVFKVLDEEEKSEVRQLPNPDIERKQTKQVAAVSKLKAAKKILNKGVVVNSKVTFDEDGEVDKVVGASASEATGSAGLDLAQAKIHMAEQDKLDKEAFRQQQKEKRREKKQKEKEMRRAKGRNDAKDTMDLGMDSDEGSVDLSFLPDPDRPKRYDSDGEEMEDSDDERPRFRGIANSSDDEEEDDDEQDFAGSDSEEEVVEEPQPKRRRKAAVDDAEARALALLNPF